MASFYFVLAGAVFTIVLTHRSKKDRHISYLVSAALIPVVVIAVPLLWYEGIDISLGQAPWVLSVGVQAAAAVVLGSILTTVLWRLIGKITPDAGA